jgi:predicted NAD/FAD-dependent oxidoreductase
MRLLIVLLVAAFAVSAATAGCLVDRRTGSIYCCGDACGN